MHVYVCRKTFLFGGKTQQPLSGYYEKLVMRIALRFGGGKSCKLLLPLS